MEKQQTLEAEKWVSELELSRTQKSGVAISLVIAIALAIVLAIVLVGPVLNVLGVQSIAS